jgi:hypothetical protein
MKCPETDKLLAFAAAELEPSDTREIDDHLSTGCRACTAEISEVLRLRELNRALEDAPPWAIRKAAEIPANRRAGTLTAIAGRLADLVFDSLRDPLPKGARSTHAGARQMLYRALEYDIDLRVTPMPGGMARITGQVMPGLLRAAETVDGLEVALDGHIANTALTSELGEFDLGAVTPGTYELVVEADEEAIHIGPFSVEPN